MNNNIIYIYRIFIRPWITDVFKYFATLHYMSTTLLKRWEILMNIIIYRESYQIRFANAMIIPISYNNTPLLSLSQYPSFNFPNLAVYCKGYNCNAYVKVNCKSDYIILTGYNIALCTIPVIYTILSEENIRSTHCFLIFSPEILCLKI